VLYRFSTPDSTFITSPLSENGLTYTHAINQKVTAAQEVSGKEHGGVWVAENTTDNAISTTGRTFSKSGAGSFLLGAGFQFQINPA
jgi:hypothetical protein